MPTPPHDTYDAHVKARQRIFDPTLGGRRGVERAQLAESEARDPGQCDWNARDVGLILRLAIHSERRETRRADTAETKRRLRRQKRELPPSGSAADGVGSEKRAKSERAGDGGRLCESGCRAERAECGERQGE